MNIEALKKEYKGAISDLKRLEKMRRGTVKLDDIARAQNAVKILLGKLTAAGLSVEEIEKL